MRLTTTVGVVAFGASIAAAQSGPRPLKLSTVPIADSTTDPGRRHWLRYDTYAYRWTGANQDGDCQLGVDSVAKVARATPPRGAGRAGAPARRMDLARCARPISSAAGFPGETDYLHAEEFFRRTFEAQPASDHAFSNVAMLLAERSRWRELESSARVHLAAAPSDGWAWLTLGLALHRQGSNTQATADVFTRGLSLIAPADAARLNRFERVLKPTDSARFSALPSAQHASLQHLYWTAADPLWSREGNEPQIEFLARAVYAEVRWSVEEMRVRGADTDRGDVYIRYGPPDAVVAANIMGPPCGPPRSKAAWLLTIWKYYMTPSVRHLGDVTVNPSDRGPGFTFTFCGQPMFATSQMPPPVQQTYGEIVALDPARWDNIRAIAVDSMPVQAARFRAVADSIDFLVATLPPVAAIQRVASVSGSVRGDFWVLTASLAGVVHDTLSLSSPGVRTFMHRVAAGRYVYRAEASAEGAQYASRASAAFSAGPDAASGYATRGFGMSDVLLATSATATGVARRWNDFTVTPLAGPAPVRATLSLVWENYEFASDGGSARYGVTITLERQRSSVGRIAAQIIGSIGSVVGVDRTDDRIDIRFDRTVAYAPALVDNIALSFADTPAGAYQLTVAVTDHVSGRTVSRTMTLVVAE